MKYYFLISILFSIYRSGCCFQQRSVVSEINLINFRRQSASIAVDDHIEIDENYSQLLYLKQSPDVVLIDNFLTKAECESIIKRAAEKGLSKSPVAYAGWTDDVKELIKLAAGGPAIWISLISVMMRASDSTATGLNRVEMVGQAVSTWAVSMVIFLAAITAFTQQRINQLKSMRTSTSTVLDGIGEGDRALVKKAAALLNSDWRTFEAPTVIHYAPGQSLKPHFDANRAASIEDKDRGGQTLCTLLVYCNDVSQSEGGSTKFNQLGISVQPKQGQALVFFPANRFGEFDERMEHEGTPSNEEKWVARIWKHQLRVRPPYGLPDNYHLTFNE